MVKTLYLPGAVGNAQFWHPVAERLGGDYELISWPGLGEEPACEHINSIDDLVDMVCEKISEPVNLVAQSMGGYVAIKTALRHSDKIQKLVLTVASGGVEVADLGGSNWRGDYREAFPKAARWIEEPTLDLSDAIRQLTIPALLIWGDQDPISPVAVGERLNKLLPNSHLEIIAGGDHDLAKFHDKTVAALIKDHLNKT
ncbi:MAG TPA: alpha/beta hydrolase [Rhizobiales bacterium]|uniref:Alpha/beta hydrolase fold n=2 Tax=Cohaesibacter gelatinilyticus TaxID=372072 RepID=A0A285N6D3_9HYPH|nr:alpha/beta hydrolase fold [Cohaesibacter gelatinilyticus]HAT87699.1 alpha/beta hydrolase [Hyphomicrobiales bacterium]